MSDKKEASKASSSQARSKYFDLDTGYDKRFYENSIGNVFVIILVFITYYVFQILYWWACLALGTVYPEYAMWHSVAIFIFINLWIVGMLISGYFSNEKLKHWEFYLEKINDREQAIRDQEQREAQKRDQELKQKEMEDQAVAPKATKKFETLREEEDEDIQTLRMDTEVD